MTTRNQKNMIANVDTVLLAKKISRIYNCSIEDANKIVREIFTTTQSEPVYKIVDYVSAYTNINKKVATM